MQIQLRYNCYDCFIKLRKWDGHLWSTHQISIVKSGQKLFAKNETGWRLNNTHSYKWSFCTWMWQCDKALNAASNWLQITRISKTHCPKNFLRSCRMFTNGWVHLNIKKSVNWCPMCLCRYPSIFANFWISAVCLRSLHEHQSNVMTCNFCTKNDNSINTSTQLPPVVHTDFSI